MLGWGGPHPGAQVPAADKGEETGPVHPLGACQYTGEWTYYLCWENKPFFFFFLRESSSRISSLRDFIVLVFNIEVFQIKFSWK